MRTLTLVLSLCVYNSVPRENSVISAETRSCRALAAVFLISLLLRDIKGWPQQFQADVHERHYSINV